VRRLAPWAGWIGGAAGWFGSQQLGSNFAQLDCAQADATALLLLGLLGAALAGGGGLISWQAWLNRSEETRRFVAATATLAGAVFLLAIVFQTLSSFVIPQCHA
jgi:hypothetical protein